MCFEEIFIIKSKMTNDAKSIGNNAEFIGITKMSIDVELFNFSICTGMGRHGTISSFVWVVGFIKTFGFCISFKLFNNSVSVFRIIFSYKSFNTRRIENSHIGFFRVDCLADRFCTVNEVIKYNLKIFQKILFKASDFGTIRNF